MSYYNGRIDGQDAMLRAEMERDEYSGRINQGHDMIEDGEAFMEGMMCQGMTTGAQVAMGLAGVLSSVMSMCCGGCGG
jgi:hypothetical protein